MSGFIGKLSSRSDATRRSSDRADRGDGVADVVDPQPGRLDRCESEQAQGRPLHGRLRESVQDCCGHVRPGGFEPAVGSTWLRLSVEPLCVSSARPRSWRTALPRTRSWAESSSPRWNLLSPMTISVRNAPHSATARPLVGPDERAAVTAACPAMMDRACPSPARTTTSSRCTPCSSSGSKIASSMRCPSAWMRENACSVSGGRRRRSHGWEPTRARRGVPVRRPAPRRGTRRGPTTRPAGAQRGRGPGTGDGEDVGPSGGPGDEVVEDPLVGARLHQLVVGRLRNASPSPGQAVVRRRRGRQRAGRRGWLRHPGDGLAGPDVDPVALWQVRRPRGGARLQDRVDEQVVAEHVLVRVVPHLGVVGVVEEQRAHQRPVRSRSPAPPARRGRATSRSRSWAKLAEDRRARARRRSARRCSTACGRAAGSGGG